MEEELILQKKQESQIEENYRNIQISVNFKENLDIERKRNNLDLKDGNCFYIENFLSSEECEYLIENTEKSKYQSVQNEYKPDYRCCERILAFSDELAKILWKRLLPHFESDDLDNVKPFGIGTDGVWIVKEINPCFRFCKYDKGGHFKKHKDGGFVINDDKRSVYTLMVYLNDSFKGGNTIFYQEEEKCSQKSITPKTGTVVIFNHDIDHQGDQITEGVKYIFRTDIIFERVKKINEQDFTNLEEFKQAEKLYQQSIEYLKKGDIEQSTLAYIQAEEINFKYSKSIQNKKQKIQLQTNKFSYLPQQYFTLILSQLVTGKNLSKSIIKWYLNLRLVCKGWNNLITTNNYLWRDMFCSFWHYLGMHEQILPPDMRWMILFYHRWISEKNFQVFFIDIGYIFSCYGLIGQTPKIKPMQANNWYECYYQEKNNNKKITYIDSEQQIGQTLSQIAKYSGHCHALRQGYLQYFVGYQTLQEYENFNALFVFQYLDALQHPWTEKSEINYFVMIIIICWLLREGFYKFQYPEQHPILICLPYFVEQEQKQKIILQAQQVINIPRICFKERELLALLTQNQQNGTVIILDSHISTIVSIANNEILKNTGMKIGKQEYNQLDQLLKLINQQFLLQKQYNLNLFQFLLIIRNQDYKFSKDELLQYFKKELQQCQQIIIEDQQIISIGANIFCSYPNMEKEFQIVEEINKDLNKSGYYNRKIKIIN